MRTPTPLQAVVFLSILLSVLAVFVPAFARNLRVSRMAEAIDGLHQIGKQASLIAASRETHEAYPPSVALTPREVPQGESVESEELWQDPTWLELGFKPRQPHRFAFQFESNNGHELATFRATALGDLDGDAIHSRFELSGEFHRGQQPVLFALEMDREVE